jgi:hypothetical protein
MSEELEQRVKALEGLVSSLSSANIGALENELHDDAKMMVLHTMVADLAEKAGVPVENFQRHYAIRYRWWHSYYLNRAERIDPGLAAKLDRRTPEQVSDGEAYPSIFDPPSPES